MILAIDYFVITRLLLFLYFAKFVSNIREQTNTKYYKSLANVGHHFSYDLFSVEFNKRFYFSVRFFYMRYKFP